MGVWGKMDGSEPEARPQTPDFGIWPTKEGSSQRGQEAGKRAHGCPGGVDGVMELPDAIRSLSSNLPQ